MNRPSSDQAEICAALGVSPPFQNLEDVDREIARRRLFIEQCLRNANARVLVLGISGGVDSLTAGKLAQLAIQDLRATSGDTAYQFIAMRLPYARQHDEDDAAAALRFIAADRELTVDIAHAVGGMHVQLQCLAGLGERARDLVLGNIKARTRMVVQYAVGNACNGLVIGTDHAAEAVMGFFTKFGDGACDLAPLAGLVKGQVRAIASRLGAPEQLVEKVPTADLEDLQPGKPDEEAYGVGYDEIDAFLHDYRVSARAERVIVERYRQTQHKRVGPLTP